MRRLVVATFLALALPASPVAAVPSYTEKLYTKMKETLDPDHSSTRKFVIFVSGTEGEPAQWIARQARKKLDDGRRTLTVFLEPEAVKGFALLEWERNDQSEVDWAYLAPLRRVRKDPAILQEPFLYTELTFGDLGVFRVGEHDVTLLGGEQHGGTRAYKLQEVPHEPRNYARIVTWVAADSHFPLEREFYDSNDGLLKTERIESTLAEGILAPQRIRIEDKLEGTSTELHVSDIRWDVDIPDALFDPSKLPQVADDPYWQTLNESPTAAPPPAPPQPPEAPPQPPKAPAAPPAPPAG